MYTAYWRNSTRQKLATAGRAAIRPTKETSKEASTLKAMASNPQARASTLVANKKRYGPTLGSYSPPHLTTLGASCHLSAPNALKFYMALGS